MLSYLVQKTSTRCKTGIVPEVNAAAKQQNKNTWKLAEQIKAQRILDIQKGQ